MKWIILKIPQPFRKILPLLCDKIDQLYVLLNVSRSDVNFIRKLRNY